MHISNTDNIFQHCSFVVSGDVWFIMKNKTIQTEITLISFKFVF